MPESKSPHRGTPVEVFFAFFKLGFISFGGPIAHLGYFRDEFVGRRKWIDDKAYAELVALCQFLPGPASSQVGFSLGLFRTGTLVGGLSACLAFTLPSAILMAALGLGAASFSGETADALLHGLKLVAAAIVAQAVWGMAKSLTPDLPRIGIGAAALLLASLLAGAAGQLGAIVLGAIAGMFLCAGHTPLAREGRFVPVSKRSAWIALTLAALLFIGLPVLAQLAMSPFPAFFEAFYRSGALVFGGGHVVLPLLEASVVAPGWVSADSFLAGYGLAQAMPGPLFTFAAYLGAAAVQPLGGIVAACLALMGIFLPGLLLVYGALPFAADLQARPKADAAIRGANAAVVGILAAALYDPVLQAAVLSWQDAAIAVAGFCLLVYARIPSWAVVVVLPLASLALS
ncbi:chromate efflux transporter [Oryzicola mucosus]|uniref:Chromate efflux transporter n=1 Tax=Oryzicola mucosus TaxID=2767425 RepID=A0A8J6U0Z2_9HYPH|nr:chromate efflux transporter [Oryzicola mucosus]MBD0416306.1 chromate efflux transporter [Oryzicola mucosus]